MEILIMHNIDNQFLHLICSVQVHIEGHMRREGGGKNDIISLREREREEREGGGERETLTMYPRGVLGSVLHVTPLGFK